MRLWALSDLHVGHPVNRGALDTIGEHPDDWLILAGDLCETEALFVETLRRIRPRFQRLLWVPGNHELWTIPKRDAYRGQAKYQRLVDHCRALDVLTPEDPYVAWPPREPRLLLAPLFLLYDYSFSPSGEPAGALRWARETGIECVDEHLLHPEPYPSRQAWCAHRLTLTEGRLEAARRSHPSLPLVLINHFPLRRSHAVLPAVPRFTPWCGTVRTDDWHRRFRAQVVVYGHLHIRKTRYDDGVRFEEVSLGHPGQWDPEKGMAHYLRRIDPVA